MPGEPQVCGSVPKAGGPPGCFLPEKHPQASHASKTVGFSFLQHVDLSTSRPVLTDTDTIVMDVIDQVVKGVQHPTNCSQLMSMTSLDDDGIAKKGINPHSALSFSNADLINTSVNVFCGSYGRLRHHNFNKKRLWFELTRNGCNHLTQPRSPAPTRRVSLTLQWSDLVMHCEIDGAERILLQQSTLNFHFDTAPASRTLQWSDLVMHFAIDDAERRQLQQSTLNIHLDTAGKNTHRGPAVMGPTVRGPDTVPWNNEGLQPVQFDDSWRKHLQKSQSNRILSNNWSVEFLKL